MGRKKKELIPTSTGSRAQELIASLKKGDHTISTAQGISANWHYIDFANVKLGIPILALEWLFGSRGLLAGRILQLRATFSKGKSSFMYAFYAMAQKQHKAWCMHIETEGAASPSDYVASFGCDIEDLVMAEIASLQDCTSAIDDLIGRIRGGFGGSISEKTGQPVKTVYDDPRDATMKSPIVIGIDSLSALGLETQVKEDVADMTSTPGMAQHSRLLRDWFRRRCHRFMSTQTTLILTSHETAKISVGKASWGGPQKSALAQEAIGIHATYGADVNASPYKDKGKGITLGDVITIKTFKNKISPRGRELEMYLVWNEGFDWIKTEAEFLLRHSASPFADGTLGKCYKHAHGITCDRLGVENFPTEEEFVKAFHANAELVRICREKLRIRGFGFEFEAKYQPSPTEVEDSKEEHDDGVEGNAETVPEPGDAERPEGRGPDSTPSA